MDKQIWFTSEQHKKIKTMSARRGYASMRVLVMDAIERLENATQ